MFSASVRSRVLVLQTRKENIAKATWTRRELVRRRGEHELVFGVIEERRWCCKRYRNLLPMKWSKTANVKVSLGCCSSPQMLALDATAPSFSSFLPSLESLPAESLEGFSCRHSFESARPHCCGWLIPPPPPPEGKGCWLISEQHLLQMFSGAPRPSEQRWMGRLVDPAPSRDVLQSSTSSRFWETAQACMHAVHAVCSSDGVREDRRCGIIHSDKKDLAFVWSCTVSSATIQDGWLWATGLSIDN